LFSGDEQGERKRCQKKGKGGCDVKRKAKFLRGKTDSISKFNRIQPLQKGSLRGELWGRSKERKIEKRTQTTPTRGGGKNIRGDVLFSTPILEK